MHRILALTFCMLLFPGALLAVENTGGLYLAPKLMYAYTVMDTMKGDSVIGSLKSDDSDDGIFGGALALGYRFDSPVRLEIEAGMFEETKGKFKKSGIEVKQKYEIYTAFINFYWDFAGVNWPVTPYLGMGVGASYIDSKGKIGPVSLGSKDTTNLAANATAGITFNLNEHLALDLGYRFVYLGEAKSKTEASLKVKSEDIYMHQANLGLRITF